MQYIIGFDQLDAISHGTAKKRVAVMVQDLGSLLKKPNLIAYFFSCHD